MCCTAMAGPFGPAIARRAIATSVHVWCGVDLRELVEVARIHLAKGCSALANAGDPGLAGDPSGYHHCVVSDPASASGPGQPPEPRGAEGPAVSPEPGGQELHGGSGLVRRHSRTIPFTRASATWVAVIAAMVALVVVLVFILENLRSVKVTFFGAHWSVPLGVDLLLAAVLGGLVVVLVGMVRILQLRREARRRSTAPQT